MKIMGRELHVPTAEEAGAVSRQIDTQIEKISVQLQQLIRERDLMRAALESCADYFDDRADADHNGVRFTPNTEMRLLTEVREALGE